MTQAANLIFFNSDNHTRELLGCYGHPLAKTPALDRLAVRGTLFRNAYCASPLCCPARAAIATGRYPHQTGYWDNAIVYDGRVPSWMHRIRGDTSAVVAVGKLHFRSSEDDNGFTDEVEPMHAHAGKGSVSGLLRALGEEQPNKGKFWDMYAKHSGPGNTPYQDYDRRITSHAIDWLKRHGRETRKPWVLFVSYVSPHPPFTAPPHLYTLYPEKEMPLPPAFRKGEFESHPALDYLRRITGMHDIEDVAMLRRIVAGYLGLISHVDEQIGQVLAEAEALGLLGNTRVIYGSDHGESFGAHGLFGKKTLYESSIGVPLIAAGPSIKEGMRSGQLVSHVDLFPTIVQSVGARLAPEDADLPGVSLWPALRGESVQRIGFSEYHAAGSAAGSFALRNGDFKFIHHVGMPPQLFDLAADPDERHDLSGRPEMGGTVARLVSALRMICDPEAVDARAKADQRARIEALGGVEAIKSAQLLGFSPPPGVSAEEAWAAVKQV